MLELNVAELDTFQKLKKVDKFSHPLVAQTRKALHPRRELMQSSNFMRLLAVATDWRQAFRQILKHKSIRTGQCALQHREVVARRGVNHA